ncbi:MAG: tRNA pseudouridine(38-40) synthase TruA [Puniceicoccales bacterium]|jgi:tRNA pseudouridine38-40 synthase|nr:tRNA pseudouridine(38-40) synthase TruA [Puniceicoccales bacterium]
MGEQCTLAPSPQQDAQPDVKIRFVCTVAYDGTDFHGWQTQAEARTVQSVIEKRLAEIMRAHVRIHGSGRTDAGVHATGQVFHFDAVWCHGLDTLQRALRTGLPRSIQITRTRLAPAGFHARFSACGKRYRYHFYEGFAPPMSTRYCYSLGMRRLNVEVMREAASLLLGVHDFTAFGGRQYDDFGMENPVKDLRCLNVIRRGKCVDIVTEASGYLYKMVRRLSGGLMQVGLGQMSPGELVAYRDARERLAIVPAVPAPGLVMERVFYRTRPNATADARLASRRRRLATGSDNLLG